MRQRALNLHGRQTVREARRLFSRTMAAGNTVAVGDHYGTLRGFIVGVAKHNSSWNNTEKKKALKAAKAAFTAAWIAESRQ
jgi:hypothetical protein